jgi:hypothetical protein
VSVTSLATGHIKFHITFHSTVSHLCTHLLHLVALVVITLTGLCPLGFASIAALLSPPSRPCATVTGLCLSLSPLSPSFSSLYPSCLHRCHGLSFIRHCRGRRCGSLAFVVVTTTTTLLSLITQRLYNYCYRGLPLPMEYCRIDVRAMDIALLLPEDDGFTQEVASRLLCCNGRSIRP